MSTPPLHFFLQSLTCALWISRPHSPLSVAVRPNSPVSWGCQSPPSADGLRRAVCPKCASGNGRRWKPRPRRLQPIPRLPKGDPYPRPESRQKRLRQGVGGLSGICSDRLERQAQKGVPGSARCVVRLLANPQIGRCRTNPDEPLKRQTPAECGGLTRPGEWPYACEAIRACRKCTPLF